jgi:hypothetical protein
LYAGGRINQYIVVVKKENDWGRRIYFLFSSGPGGIILKGRIGVSRVRLINPHTPPGIL